MTTDRVEVPPAEPGAQWAGLRAALLLGTTRRPAPTGIAVGAVLVAGSASSLLDAAALWAAGRGPVSVAGVAVPPCPPDPTPVVSATAVAVLDLVLPAGDQPGSVRLVSRWLARAATAGQRLPHSRVVALLELGTARPGLRAGVRAVLGERGRWVAGGHEPWAWATGRDESPAWDEQAWEHGSAQERMRMFAALRAADPERARQVLAGAWPSLSAAERSALLAGMRHGFGPADWDWVGQVRQASNSAQVRVLATDMLASDPASPYSNELTAQLRAWTSRRGAQIGFEPDRDLTEADCVAAGMGKPPPGLSATGWWLSHAAAAAPLSLWLELPDSRRLPRARVGVAELVAAGNDELRDGWVRAAVRQRDQVWLEALAGHAPTPAVLAALPPDRAVGVLVAHLRGKDDPQGDLALAGAISGRWQRNLASVLIDRFAAAQTHPEGDGSVWLEHLDPADGDLLRAAIEGLPEDPPKKVAGAVAARRRQLRAAARDLAMAAAIDAAFTDPDNQAPPASPAIQHPDSPASPAPTVEEP